MKKRFVAKQVGVLSLTAVLAGMPAVNVLAEDVYAQKVESLQKEMLEQAVATETKLNITFETVHGEKVGETVAKTTATGTGDWTFMLGTDYQLPAGYQLATGVEQVTNVAVPFGATAGHTVVVEPVAGAVTETKLNITFETVHGEKVGETVASTTAAGTGDWTFMLGTDYQLPAGYQLATGVEQVTNVAVPFGATAGHTVVVEPVAGAVTETKLNITFETVHGEKVGETVAKTTATGTGDWTFMLGTDYQLPEGYQLATGVEQVTNVAVPFGATAGHTVVVEPVAGAVTETKLNITFETVHGEKVGETVAKTTATGTGDWTFMLGTDYQLPEGYQLATGVEQVTNVAVPFGATAGHTVVVEPVQEAARPTVLTVTFETVYGEKVGETVASTTATGTGDWTFMLGTDYQLPEGYQLATGVEQVTNVAVPFGATAGHTVVVEPVAGAVTETKLNITFETVHGEKVGETVAKTTATGTGDWTFMLGTDYQLPEGYQLATGVEQVTNVAVPFGATAGHTVVVEPVQEAARPTVLTVTFETVYGEKVGETVASTTATGIGDWTFMLGTDYQLPEGYQLATGVEQVTNVAVPFGATAGHTVVVEPVAGEVVETKLNVTFETVYGEKVGEAEAKTTATGADGEAWTFMLGTDFNLPEGWQLAAGVEQVTNVAVPFGATAGHTVVVEPVAGEVVETKLNVTFETVYGEKVGEAEAKTTATGADGEAWTFMLGTDFNLPEGWQLAAGVEQVTNVAVPFGATAGHTVVVEPVAGAVTETKLNITFETVHGEKVGETVAKTTATGTGDWTFMLGTDYQLPEGYQLATGVEQVTNIQVPFGATAGHTVVVEPVQEAVRPTVLTVTFETVYGEKVGETVASTTATGIGDWTFMLGTDYQLPAGYQLAVGVDQVTNIQVPFGATAGHTVVVEPVAGEVVETKLNVIFETVYGEKVGEAEAKTTATGADGEAWTFMLGTDFNLPEGYKLAEGVEQVTNIQVPFGATAGHTVVVEPVAGEVVETKLNVTFETVDGEKVGEAEAKTTATGADGEAWTFMLGTDFNLPEGYKLAEGVEQVTNIQVPFGATAGHTMIVEKNTETPDKPDPENPEKPDPENPEKPNPENPEKPNPENPEKPNPENPEKPNQDNTNKDDGKTQEKDKKTENKSKTPKTGDDLQAAGTFSILGAGALAAIAALLKKRK